MKRIIIAGAGFGGVKVFNRLQRLLGVNKEWEVMLINDVNYFLFTPLLHEVATGSLSPEDIIVPLPPLVKRPGARFMTAQVLKVLSIEKRLVTDRGEFIYDYLVLGLGAQTNYYDTPGAAQYALPLKDLDDAARIKNKIIKQFEQAQCLKTAEARRAALTFVVVGGGATGVELAGELADFCTTTFCQIYGRDLGRAVRILLVQRDDHILPQFSQGLRERSLAMLGRKGVEVLVNIGVARVTENNVALTTGEIIPAATVVWTAGVKPRALKAAPELPAVLGRLRVNSYLQSINDDNIFVLGDLAYLLNPKTQAPLPMLAQVADRQAKVVATNIVNLINSQSLQTFSYRSQGSIVSLGSWFAVSEIMNLHFAGRLAWLLWRAVYWSKMPTISKKLQIGLDWLIIAFMPRDVSLLPFTNHDIHQS
ncbi:MAG: NAD(P)/FAD-dependent oxidoreductase [bacterium]|nr:NAD(P)/FAD-dependent oxidoreductase [bacterium]